MINKRIFGSDIPNKVKKKLEARQLVAKGDKLPGDSITDSKYKDSRKSYYKYDELINSDFEMEADLSSRTPFARMWTAVALVRPLDTNIDELSSDKFDKLTDDEKKGFKRLTHKIYAVGTNDLSTIDSLVNPNQSLDNMDELNYAIFPNELGQKQISNDSVIEGNKFLKPQAGILSVSSETGGTLGSIKTTEVKFMVHNFTDYDQIYNKYFLRPGAQVFVDFGWSSQKTPLYNPADLLDDSDGIGVKTKLYGEKDLDGVDGYVTEQAGDLETLIGIVTKYDSKIMENGSVECSLTITSKNQALNLATKSAAEAEAEINSKFEFEIDNLIKFEAVYSLASKDTRAFITRALERANSNSAEREKAAFDLYINELAFSSLGGSGNFNPTTLAMESGVFLVGDDAISADQYISWGIIEDKILNKYFGHGDGLEKINSLEKDNLEIGIDSSKSFTSYHPVFNVEQNDCANPPAFVVPPYWDRTHQTNTKKGGKSGRTIEERRIDFTTSPVAGEKLSESEFNEKINTLNEELDAFIGRMDLDDETTMDTFVSQQPNDKTPISKYDSDRFRVPIREIFVNATVVKKAFTQGQTFKEVVNMMLDEINEEAYKIWNWTLASDGDSNVMSIIDTNQLGIAEAREENRFEKTFMFNIMSNDSIVTNYDVSFEMPAGQISSMYAIQAMAGTNKQMFPVSTLIEEQAVLQSLLSKVGEENSKLKFRYLPDLGTHNAQQTSDDAADVNKYTNLYNEIQDIIDSKPGAKSPYGENFPSDNKFETFVSDESGELSQAEREALNASIEEKRTEFNKQRGQEQKDAKTLRREEITGKFEAERLPRPMPFPMKLGLTTYGISTLKPGDIFRVDYLPQVYLEKVYFQILNVSHKVESSGWYTDLETQFRIKPEEVDNTITIDAPRKPESEQTEGEGEVPIGKDKETGESKKAKEVVPPKKYKKPRGPVAIIKSTDDIWKSASGTSIKDKKAYRWRTSALGHCTYTDDYEKQTYHVPTYGSFKNSGYAAIYSKDTGRAITKEKFDDGAIIYRREKFRYVMDFEDLYQYCHTVYDYKAKGAVIPGFSNNMTFLYKVTLSIKDVLDDGVYGGILISNPMYLWDRGDNRRNGYGYSRCFHAEHNEKGDTAGTFISTWSSMGFPKVLYPYVRGIYRHGEQVWFGGRQNGAEGMGDNTHWFIAPCGTFDEDFVKQGLPFAYLEGGKVGERKKRMPESSLGNGYFGYTLEELIRQYSKRKNQTFDKDWFTAKTKKERIEDTQRGSSIK